MVPQTGLQRNTLACFFKSLIQEQQCSSNSKSNQKSCTKSCKTFKTFFPPLPILNHLCSLRDDREKKEIKSIRDGSLCIFTQPSSFSPKHLQPFPFLSQKYLQCDKDWWGGQNSMSTYFPSFFFFTKTFSQAFGDFFQIMPIRKESYKEILKASFLERITQQSGSSSIAPAGTFS